MTPEQIIEMAKRANVSIRGHYDETGSTPAELQRFAKEVMRITADGVWVDPDMTTNEAAKAVIAALDEHIKHVFAKKDAAMRQAFDALYFSTPIGVKPCKQNADALEALKRALNQEE